MTEFADLLKKAAGRPPRPLDMAIVRERAMSLGLRRRVGVWLVAFLAVVGSGVPIGVGLAPSGDRPADVRTIDGHGQPRPSDRTADPSSRETETAGETQVRIDRPKSTTGTPGRPEQTGTSDTIDGEDPSTSGEPDDEDRCTRAGPVAAECGEAGATACWAARVGCPTTTTTAPPHPSR